MHYAVPAKTPTEELNKRMLIYFRPWVTLSQDASAHVPLASNLCPDQNWTNAWNTYASGGVLHRSLQQWIQNFRMVHSSMRDDCDGTSDNGADEVCLPEDLGAEDLLRKIVKDPARLESYAGLWTTDPYEPSADIHCHASGSGAEATKQANREKRAPSVATPRPVSSRAVPGAVHRARPSQPVRSATAMLTKAFAMPVNDAIDTWWRELRARKPSNREKLGPPNAEQSAALELVSDRVKARAHACTHG